MSSALRDRCDQLLVETVLDRYSGLRIIPTRGDELCLAGPLTFRVTGPGGEVIEDEYEVELRVSSGFPTAVPLVRETGGRIAIDYHKLEGGFLCLGASTALRLILHSSPTLLTFVERIVIPYLYGHSYSVKYGARPYGELDHGDDGIRTELGDIFGARSAAQPEEFLRLASLQKRRANMESCPCGSGFRVGRCHNQRVNNFRIRMGRLWCRDEYLRVMRALVSRRGSAGRLFSSRTRAASTIKRSV